MLEKTCFFYLRHCFFGYVQGISGFIESTVMLLLKAKNAFQNSFVFADRNASFFADRNSICFGFFPDGVKSILHNFLLSCIHSCVYKCKVFGFVTYNIKEFLQFFKDFIFSSSFIFPFAIFTAYEAILMSSFISSNSSSLKSTIDTVGILYRGRNCE